MVFPVIELNDQTAIQIVAEHLCDSASNDQQKISFVRCLLAQDFNLMKAGVNFLQVFCSHPLEVVFLLSLTQLKKTGFLAAVIALTPLIGITGESRSWLTENLFLYKLDVTIDKIIDMSQQDAISLDQLKGLLTEGAILGSILQSKGTESESQSLPTIFNQSSPTETRSSCLRKINGEIQRRETAEKLSNLNPG